MRYVVYVMVGAALIALGLSASQHLWTYGEQGYFVLGLCAIPALLGALALARRRCPRWIPIVSALAFLLVGVKTTDDRALENIMMAAALGLVLAAVLAIRPPRPVAA